MKYKEESLLFGEYKWSLLKVRKRKYKGEHGGVQVEFGGQESAFLSHVLLKLTQIYGKGATRWFPSSNQ
jgi:hypothetical protein